MLDMRVARRQFLRRAGAAGLLAASPALRALAAETDLHLAGPPSRRPLTAAFPGKGEMILQRTRPPLLETPFAVFDHGVFTPNDRFFVRWHLAGIPENIEPAAFRLRVFGKVSHELSLTLDDVRALPRFEIAAVNQCSGNSRGFFEPRVPGGEWGNGAMGNARWGGVRLRDVLDKAAVAADAVQVRFGGLDTGILPATPDFEKSLTVDHARDGEVMIADTMNGEPLPLLNGFPLRLVVPGWYSTYWLKMLDSIEVLGKPDEKFWMKTAYRIPDTPGASVKPGEKGFKTVPINRMVPRSFITNLADGATVPSGKPLQLRGIAFGGDNAVARVEVSESGSEWRPARLGSDEGKYGFRRWQADVGALTPGHYELKVRASNTAGLVQPSVPNWNSGGYMRNVVETTTITVA